MTQTTATQPTAAQPSDKAALRPFHFEAREAELAELRRRIEATRWPSRELVSDRSQGVQLTTLQELAGMGSIPRFSQRHIILEDHHGVGTQDGDAPGSRLDDRIDLALRQHDHRVRDPPSGPGFIRVGRQHRDGKTRGLEETLSPR